MILVRKMNVSLRDTNMAAGNQWKHLEFTLALSKLFFFSAKLQNIRIDTSLNILVIQNLKTLQGELIFLCT